MRWAAATGEPGHTFILIESQVGSRGYRTTVRRSMESMIIVNGWR